MIQQWEYLRLVVYTGDSWGANAQIGGWVSSINGKNQPRGGSEVKLDVHLENIGILGYELVAIHPEVSGSATWIFKRPRQVAQ